MVGRSPLPTNNYFQVLKEDLLFYLKTHTFNMAMHYTIKILITTTYYYSIHIKTVSCIEIIGIAKIIAVSTFIISLQSCFQTKLFCVLHKHNVLQNVLELQHLPTRRLHINIIDRAFCNRFNLFWVIGDQLKSLLAKRVKSGTFNSIFTNFEFYPNWKMNYADVSAATAKYNSEAYRVKVGHSMIYVILHFFTLNTHLNLKHH